MLTRLGNGDLRVWLTCILEILLSSWSIITISDPLVVSLTWSCHQIGPLSTCQQEYRPCLGHVGLGMQSSRARASLKAWHSRLVSATLNTAPLNSSLYCTTDLLAGTSIYRAFTCTFHRNCQCPTLFLSQILSRVQAWESSLPVLQPDCSIDCHFVSTRPVLQAVDKPLLLMWSDVVLVLVPPPWRL